MLRRNFCVSGIGSSAPAFDFSRKTMPTVDVARFSKTRGKAKIAVCACVMALFASPLAAQSTYVCNETSEPIYISVRHNAASLFTANSRTEGWYRLGVRGLLRSCTNFNRYARDHYIVGGVMRDGEIVPVRFRLRRYDIRRTVNLCVPTSVLSFEYRSEAKSDGSCGNGYQLARASAGVLGGSNDVWIDFGGDTSNIK